MNNFDYKLSERTKTKIFSYLQEEWTSVYEKAFLFDKYGKLVDKWVGLKGGIQVPGIYEEVAEMKKKNNYPIFVHTHPAMTSFSDFDFTTMILNDKLTSIAQWVATKNINFIFIPQEEKFLHSRGAIITYLKEKKEYIWWDESAKKLLKEKAFKGENFPNAYKYFWNSYITATAANFMGADFYAIPLNERGEKYCNLIKKGLKVLSGLELKME